MKKFAILLIFIIFITLLSILISYNKEIIDFLINVDLRSPRVFYSYIFISTIYFISPLPITIIILINGFVLKEYGFYFSMLQILVGSFFINIFSNRINSFVNISSYYKKNIKKLNLKKISENNYSIFFSRYLFPYFLHNILFGLIKIKINRFLLLIFMAEIPTTYALNSIGTTLNKISFDHSLPLYSLFTNINFYIPFVLILIIFVVVDILSKKII
tara:strand:+ start:249 stop:896 length:648 start_codon:yes stop_codon:yes gene_type:complete